LDAYVKAVLCTAYGEPRDLSIAEIDQPAPAGDELLVSVEAVGLGYVDALRVRGGYQIKPPLPFVAGSEIAGTVIGAGRDVAPGWIGKRVAGWAVNGGLAEQACLKAVAAMEIPSTLSSQAASGFGISYCTALYGLDTCGKLQAGETVLVLGAGGGVGLAFIDVAKMMGARVIAAASNPSKLEAARASGADLLVDYSGEDWRKRVEAAAGDNGINVVVDSVGGDYSETAFRCLRPGGRLLVIGFANGTIPRIPLNLALLKRASIVGVDWGGFRTAEPGGASEILSKLATHLAAGRLHPPVTSVHRLEDAPGILQDLLERRSVGKPVIVV
jgi:NADPH2:quinone reductase